VLGFGDYLNVQCHACIRGTNIGDNLRKLDFGQYIVSRTPRCDVCWIDTGKN